MVNRVRIYCSNHTQTHFGLCALHADPPRRKCGPIFSLRFPRQVDPRQVQLPVR